MLDTGTVTEIPICAGCGAATDSGIHYINNTKGPIPFLVPDYDVHAASSCRRCSVTTIHSSPPLDFEQFLLWISQQLKTVAQQVMTLKTQTFFF